MSFADTHQAVVPRLGLRARWRAMREARITSARGRQRLADRVEAAIDRASRSQGGLSAVVPVSAEAAGLARPALLELAERLRSPQPLDPRGVLRTRALLVDGGGPLYVSQEPGELRAAALRALDALDGRRAIE